MADLDVTGYHPGVSVYQWKRHLWMASEKQLCEVRAERGPVLRAIV